MNSAGGTFDIAAGSRKSRLRVPWTVADVTLATVLVITSFFVIGLILSRLADFGDEGRNAYFTPWLIGIWEGMMLAAVWAFSIRKHGCRWRELGLRRPENHRRIILPSLALLGSLGFAAVYSAIVVAVGGSSFLPPPLPEGVLGDGLARLLSILVIVVWGPFVEEVFFRGFLLGALVGPLGAIRAAVLSSAIFAAAHILVGAMIPIFITALLLSWLYLRTRSIWPPLMMHAAQNLIVVSTVV